MTSFYSQDKTGSKDDSTDARLILIEQLYFEIQALQSKQRSLAAEKQLFLSRIQAAERNAMILKDQLSKTRKTVEALLRLTRSQRKSTA